MKSIDQMNELVSLLMEFDANDNQTYSMRCLLATIVSEMISNPEIYGEVRDIVIDLYDKLHNHKAVQYGVIAANICLYL